jgi:hypothetical protein
MKDPLIFAKPLPSETTAGVKHRSAHLHLQYTASYALARLPESAVSALDSQQEKAV